MSESAKIVGFDRRNIPLHVGDTIQDVAGRKFTIISEDGEIEGEAVGQLGYLQDLNGAERLGPSTTKEPAQVPESLRKLHAYDDPRLTRSRKQSQQKEKPSEQAEKKVAAPYRGGRKNHSGLVRVYLIAKAAGYGLGNPTKVLRVNGFEILKNKTGQPCVRVKDQPAAYDLLAVTSAEAAAAAADSREWVERELPPVIVGNDQAAASIESPAVDYDALKEQEAEVAVRGILAQFEDEALVAELRVRGWTVSCTKSI